MRNALSIILLLIVSAVSVYAQSDNREVWPDNPPSFGTHDRETYSAYVCGTENDVSTFGQGTYKCNVPLTTPSKRTFRSFFLRNSYNPRNNLDSIVTNNTVSDENRERLLNHVVALLRHDNSTGTLRDIRRCSRVYTDIDNDDLPRSILYIAERDNNGCIFKEKWE